MEKALTIIIFMYAMSFGLLGAQYMLADSFGVVMTSYDGTPLKSNILQTADFERFTDISEDVLQTNSTTIRTNPVIAAAEIIYELFQILTGTYIFQVLSILGVPAIFVTAIIFIYFIFMIRAVVLFLRGIVSSG